MPVLLINENNCEEQIALARRRTTVPGCRSEVGCYERSNDLCSTRRLLPSTSRFPRIAREKWKDLCRELNGLLLGDLTRGVLPPHDQGRTNYCWAHGVVRAAECLHLYYSGVPEILSAESVAVPVTAGINRGGSIDEAIDRMIEYGACNQSLWPLNNLDVRSAKDGWEANALEHSILRWVECENFDDQFTMLLHRIPVPCGLRWWGHLVCQVDPVYLDDVPELDGVNRPSGQFGVGFWNSYGAGYGDGGYAYLDEKHATADLGAIAPISITLTGVSD